MTTQIHPTAIVDPKAELGADVEIGPNAVIEAGVTIGDRTKIGPMVHIQGTTTLGPDNVIYTGATIGFPPQYLGFSGAPTPCVIGAGNVIREYVSIHRGLQDDSATRIGDGNFLMGFSHVAHDCQIGNGVIIANGALLAGHINVGDRAFISGNVVIHQFCRVGRLAMVGGLARVSNDVPPFMIVEGHPAVIRGVNVVGLKRAGFASHTRMELKRLLKLIYRPGATVRHAVDGLDPTLFSPEARELIEFYKSGKRGITRCFLQRVARSAEPDAEESDE